MRPPVPGIHLFSGFDIAHLVETWAAAKPDHPFLIWQPFNGPAESWSYGRFRDETGRLAQGLANRGLRQGDMILVHMDNQIELLLIWYAAARLGAVTLTTNARSVQEELAYFIANSGAKAAITQPKFRDLVAAAGPDLKFIAVTAHDNGEPPAQRVAASEAFSALFADDIYPLRPADPGLAVGVQYTSGTTSRPKGVLWTHANALWGAKICASHMDMNGRDVHLVYLPLFHTNAQSYSILSTLWVGGTAVVQPRFSASRFWDVSAQYGCTWTSMVPFCAKALLEQPKPLSHSYRYWGNGICEPPFDAHFGVKTIGWWGMSETITHGTVGDPHLPNRPMSMGRPAPEYELEVRTGGGTGARAGETGHLWIKGVPGLSLFREYLGNDKATQDSFDDRGFFDTGDRVTLAEDGFLIFADRDKDMLKVGGENVAASEIERVVASVAGVGEVAVVGRKHPMLDEVPVAFVLPAGGLPAASPDLKDRILAACATGLADFKRPRDVRLVDALPRSTLEKIAKAELRKVLAAEDPA